MKSINSWFNVEHIDDRTFAISEYAHVERVHSFLLLGEERAALIDTGLGVSDIRRVVDALTPLPIIVLTTHAHWDHIGGHKYFDDISIHEGDAGWLTQGIPLPEGEVERALGDASYSGGKPKWFDNSQYIVYRGKPDKILNDGEIIDLGKRQLQIIHTPGHSPGHVCIHESSTGYLATGDLLYEGTLYCNFPSTEPNDYLKSLNKIAQLKVNKILPGHNSLEIGVAAIRETRELLDTLCDKGTLQHDAGLQGEGEIKILL